MYSRLLLKCPSWIFQGGIVKFRLSMSNHKGLYESLVAIKTALSESASTLKVVSAFLRFVFFVELFLHNIKL